MLAAKAPLKDTKTKVSCPVRNGFFVLSFFFNVFDDKSLELIIWELTISDNL